MITQAPERARAALRAYTQTCDGTTLDQVDDWQTLLSDLFGDLMLFLAAEGEDPSLDEALARGETYYTQESGEVDEACPGKVD
ncbi:hypothetical protein [Kitasatospora purpeofusca]|uniref:hypothetical protein n=1 Tax=Kitasatospora purpeofusca TaxID=67352 RepID=UPI0036B9FD62